MHSLTYVQKGYMANNLIVVCYLLAEQDKLHFWYIYEADDI